MKNMNILDRLYDMSLQSPLPSRHELEIQRTRENLVKLIADPQKEDAILDYGIAYERKGFDAGFILAVHIMSQCVCPSSVPESLLPFES